MGQLHTYVPIQNSGHQFRERFRIFYVPIFEWTLYSQWMFIQNSCSVSKNVQPITTSICKSKYQAIDTK